MIELKQGPDDKSVTVSDGNNSFSITFCEVPRAEDNGILSHQRVHDPYKGQGASLRPVFPFRVYDSPKLKDSRALAIKGQHLHPQWRRMHRANQLTVWCLPSR